MGAVRMTGYEYEKKCAELLEAKGFSNVQVTPGSGDQGIDILAKKEKKRYGVQCKYYEGPVGNKAVQEAYAGAKFYDCDIALVITNSTLTRPAQELACKLGVEAWENIDAVFLQQHDAKLLQKELERKEQVEVVAEKMKQAQQQMKLQEFLQWKSTYVSAINARMAQIEAWKQEIVQSYEQKISSASACYDSERSELDLQVENLKQEQDLHSKKLAELHIFQFPIKGQEKKRIKEIDIVLSGIASKKPELEQVHQAKLEGFRTSMEQEIAGLTHRAETEIHLPKVPPVVQWMKTNFHKMESTLAQCDEEEAKSLLPPWMESLSNKEKASVLQELIIGTLSCSYFGMTVTDLQKNVPELHNSSIDFINFLLSVLRMNGRVTCTEKDGKAYFKLA